MFDITQRIGSLSMRAVTSGDPCAPAARLRLFAGPSLLASVLDPRPTVTWRVTRSSNLNRLIYLDGPRPRSFHLELTTGQCLALIRDLGAFKVPRLVFAGGEPLMRADLPEFVAYAREL